ncbi:MAG: hypothetical protein P9M14_18170 [Candidatus Alcyoniella australis]|nr:hypothetical protein [Candidatus Alcyoniella australis]
MRHALALSALLLLLPGPAAADATQLDSTPFQYQKQVQLPQQFSGDYALIALDGEVFDAARRDLGDLRLDDGSGTPVPYKLLDDNPRWVTQSVSVQPTNMAAQADGTVRFELEMPEGLMSYNQLFVQTDQHNFRCRVDMDAMVDGQWSRVQHGMGIFDYTDEVQSRHLRLRHPETDARRIRLRIRCQSGSIIKPDAVRVERNIKFESRLIRRDSVLVSRVDDPEAKTTTLRYDLGHSYLISHVTFDVQGTNFSRPVRLFALLNVDDWRPVAAQNIFSVDSELYHAQNLTISFPEAWTREIKVMIEQGDNPPLAVQGISAYGQGRYLLIPALPGAQINLFYGAPGVKAPVYDIQAVYEFLPDVRPEALSLSPQSANPEYVCPATPAPPRDYKPLLTAALILAVLVLAGLIFRLARRSQDG